jgi:ribonuclease P protein component
MATLAPGTDLVVRVLPAAAGETYQRLGQDLDTAIGLARRRRSRPAKPANAAGVPAGEG